MISIALIIEAAHIIHYITPSFFIGMIGDEYDHRILYLLDPEMLYDGWDINNKSMSWEYYRY